MALIVGILLAVLVLPTPWDYAAVAAGGAIEVGEAALWWRWTHRRRPAAGATSSAVTVRRGTCAARSSWTAVAGASFRPRPMRARPAARPSSDRRCTSSAAWVPTAYGERCSHWIFAASGGASFWARR